MIGFKQWSKVLTLASKSEPVRLLLVADWATAVPVIFAATGGLSASSDDKTLWEERFVLALNNLDRLNNPVSAQLFYGLKGEIPAKPNILRCPQDCIPRFDLIAMAGIILGHDTVEEIQATLTRFALTTSWYNVYQHHTDQFKLIHKHIGPAAMAVPVKAFLGCDDPVKPKKALRK
ncbi:MAG: hypothetical protein V4650_04250 [Pseudomonadota bacterium]